MYTLNLHLDQVAALELADVEYVLHNRNLDGVTFKVEFVDINSYTRALEILIRR